MSRKFSGRSAKLVVGGVELEARSWSCEIRVPDELLRDSVKRPMPGVTVSFDMLWESLFPLTAAAEHNPARASR